MSELIKNNDNRATIRWKLLTSASALALTISTVGIAHAEDADRPLVWIELGGQAETVTGQGAPFSPDFLSVYSASAILQEKVTPLQAQNPPLFSFGEEASISFQPENSDWVFSAGIRIGRSSNRRHVDHQTRGVHFKYVNGSPVYTKGILTIEKFVDTHVYHAESHSILDFMAGKDVGLGMFGLHGSSVLSAGVRFAQFSSQSSVDMRARPDFKFRCLPSSAAPTHFCGPSYFHTYHAAGEAERSFRGVGPALSWNGSAPFVGTPQDGELTFDWGANAALLFGKQTARVGHQQTGLYWPKYAQNTGFPIAPTAGGHTSRKLVTVPNVGGSAGLTWRLQDFKVSMGYRADFFFGAMDVGIDTRKSATLGFYGPFASVSVGFGG